MEEMIKSIDFNKKIQSEILGGVRVPHSTSQPVIHFENEKYYLAVFVFYFEREDIAEAKVNRPTKWAICDLVTGEIIEKRDTKENDFSDASYDVKYDISSEGLVKIENPREYYEEVFSILDEVREEYIEKGSFNSEKYLVYLNKILDNIPEGYRRFFRDLSV